MMADCRRARGDSFTPCRFMWGQPPSAVRSSAARLALASEPTSASSSSSNTKGRPRAAGVETTAEDIRFLGRFQGAPGLGFDWSRGGVFAFYSPLRILHLRDGF